MRIAAVSVCRRFWRRLSACAPSWQETSGRFGSIRFLVGYVQDSPPIEHLPPCVELVRVESSEVVDADGRLSKSAVLRKLLDGLSTAPPTHVLFTDCDVVFPADLTESVVGSAPYQVADRIDLDEAQTMAFMRVGEFPAAMPPINPTKRGMGWFQLVRWEVLSYATKTYRWDRPGYDVFDWVLNRDLSAVSRQHLVPCSPFVHLWHGDPGSTWQGTKTDL